MPKVEDASIWLRWAVDPVSALRVLILPPLLALPTHFLLLLRPYLPLPLQAVGTPSRRPSSRTPPLRRPGSPRRWYAPSSVVLFSSLRLKLSHRLFPMLARRWGIRKAGKAARFGEQGAHSRTHSLLICLLCLIRCSLTRLYYTVSSTLNPLSAHFWIDYLHNHLPGPMKRYYLSQIAYWLQQALVRFDFMFWMFFCAGFLGERARVRIFRCVRPPAAHRRRDLFVPCASIVFWKFNLGGSNVRPSTGG
ncbi:hypothetical protein B0H13DRAFT_2358920 [Mycena leptocephala]|nr:hypothetical protein B0H13DRAFT_2358920 [Mycena leptocephala]